MATRVYRIIETHEDKTQTTHLVDAANQSKALAVIVKPKFAVDIPSTQEVIELTKGGVELIKA